MLDDDGPLDKRITLLSSTDAPLPAAGTPIRVNGHSSLERAAEILDGKIKLRVVGAEIPEPPAHMVEALPDIAYERGIPDPADDDSIYAPDLNHARRTFDFVSVQDLLARP